MQEEEEKVLKCDAIHHHRHFTRGSYRHSYPISSTQCPVIATTKNTSHPNTTNTQPHIIATFIKVSEVRYDWPYHPVGPNPTFSYVKYNTGAVPSSCYAQIDTLIQVLEHVSSTTILRINLFHSRTNHNQKCILKSQVPIHVQLVPAQDRHFSTRGLIWVHFKTVH